MIEHIYNDYSLRCGLRKVGHRFFREYSVKKLFFIFYFFNIVKQVTYANNNTNTLNTILIFTALIMQVTA